MSLLVWMPLISDYRNNGVGGNINFIQTGTVSTVPGKIGYCKQFSNSNVIGNFSFTLGSEASLCMWVNHTELPGTSSNNWLFDIASTSGYDNSVIGLSIRYRDNFCVCVGGKYDQSVPHNMVINKWYHVAFVYKDPVVKLYVNGQLLHTYTNLSGGTKKTGTKISLGSNVVNSSTKLKGMLNDVRFYDHAISDKEVYELSKGLIFHYPMNGGLSGFANPNMISDDAFYNEPWNSQISFRGEYDGKDAILVSANGLYSKTGKGTTSLFPDVTFEAGKQYTISLWWRDDYRTDGYSTSLYIRFRYDDGTATNIISPPSSNNYWNYSTLTSTAGKNVVSVTTTYGRGSYVYISSMKLEEGSEATAYTKNDDRIANNILYDCSGYSHDMVITGSILNSDDSPIGDKSALFDTCSSLTNYAITDNQLCTPSDEITLSVWVKHRQGSSHIGSYNQPINSNQSFEISCNKTARLGLVVGGTRYVVNSSNLLDDYNWHLLSVTYDGHTIRRYVDAVEYSNTSVEGSLNSGDRNFFIGRYASSESYYNSEFYQSDVRMYATALSADDIKNLYEVRHSIDNFGNAWSHELNESDDDTMSFGSNGEMNVSSISENTDRSNASIVGYEIHANDFIEA